MRSKHDDAIIEPIKRPNDLMNERILQASALVEEALKEIYSNSTHDLLTTLNIKIKALSERNKTMPSIILETLINKLSSIMEVRKFII